MNIESRQLIEALQADGDTRREAEDWGGAKEAYLRAIEEFERAKENEAEIPLTADDLELRKEIEGKLGEVNSKLAQIHFEWGKVALENCDWQRAMEEFELATELAREDDVAFLEAIKPLLDKARSKVSDRQLYEEATPYVERGDNFRRAENFGEAILEYQEALNVLSCLPPNHRYVVYVRDAIRDCRRRLVKPYLARVCRAFQNGRPKRALSLLKRAQVLVDENDTVYQAFLDLIAEQIAAKLTQQEREELEAGEEIESANWAQAVEEYEEALKQYSSFTQLDPLSPAYPDGNIYEDKFLRARRKLATLYRQRGDRFRDKAMFAKAIRQYREALKLFPKSDKAFADTFKEMQKLRAQLGSSNSQVKTESPS